MLKTYRHTFVLVPCALVAFAQLASVAMAEELIEAKLLEIEGDAVKLSKGRDQGVRAGQVYDLYRDAEVYYLPLTHGSKPLVRTQQVVGQVVVYHAEPSTSRALIVTRKKGEDGREIEITKGLQAVENPTAHPPNRPPRFTQKPTTQPIPWRQTQRLVFRVANEPGEQVVYTWTASGGGKLAHERTLTPVNTWTAPPRKGSYSVNVVATDLAGQQARETVTVASTGMPTRYKPGEFTVRRAFGTASRYSVVEDFAFDGLNRHYVLERGRGGFLSRGSLALKVELPDRAPMRLPVTGKEFSTLVVSNPRRGPGGWVPGGIFALDADSRTVLRYSFGPAWPRVLQQEPVVIGNPESASGNATFQRPVDLALTPSSDMLYVLDSSQRCVQAYTSEGSFVVSFGEPGDGELQLQKPQAIAVGSDGLVYVLDNGRKMVIVYSNWRPVREFNVGAAEEDLVGLAVDPISNHVFVLDRTHGWIRRYTGGGQLSPPHYTPEAGMLKTLRRPTRLRIDPTRYLWVVDEDGRSVARLDSESLEFLGRTGGFEFSGALRIAGTPDGGVAVLDRGDFKVTVFDPDGWVVARFGGSGAGPGLFEDPIDVAVTSSGTVFVLDAEKQQVFGFSRRGSLVHTFGRPGSGTRELQGLMDMTVVADRSLLVLLQQRSQHNFNLMDPVSGRTVSTQGDAYTGEATPRFGCASEVSSEASVNGIYWSVDDTREKIRRAQQSSHPVELGREHDDISDVEPAISGLVFFCDSGSSKVFALNRVGEVVLTLSGELVGDCWDLGSDDYGRLFVYDHYTRRVLELSD